MKDSGWLGQYNSIKKKYKDAILLFRMGDFYEMFYDDAIKANRILGITLTKKRAKRTGPDIPMCGVPYHSVDGYISRLLEAGEKVAICEQLEPALPGRQLVKRGVVRVITPGTIADKELLLYDSNNYLMSVYIEGEIFSAFLVDISTGDSYIYTRGYVGEILDISAKFSPKEILVNRKGKDKLSFSNGGLLAKLINVVEDWEINDALYEDIIKEMFGIRSLGSVFSKNDKTGLYAVGMALQYIRNTQMTSNIMLKLPIEIRKENYMYIPSNTVIHLELTKNNENLGRENTLYSLLDDCKTPMGKRKLESWILAPLINRKEIEERLEIVEFFLNNMEVRERIREILQRVGDIERYIVKIVSRKIPPMEVVRFGNWLQDIETIRKLIERESCFVKQVSSLQDISHIYNDINNVLYEEPSSEFGEGKVIKESVSDELKKWVYIKQNADKILSSYEEKLRKKYNIPSLKVGYNDIYGYYIEITKVHIKKVERDKELIRRQSLKNVERFITDELKKIESDVMNAYLKIKEIEEKLYNELLDRISGELYRLYAWSDFIARIDVLISFALASERYNYTKPHFNDDGIIRLVESRHPIVEWLYKEEEFVPNDVYIDPQRNPVIIITGPNMAGKSTFLRQVGIIQVMAQIGCFVPAREANLPIVDKLFTRIGANDYLSRGESTFLVEMQETAKLLREATKDSLLILDEVGRGTSTYDGLSIAWAIVEYLIQKRNTPKTLFATHYHELTKLEKKGKIENLNILVEEDKGNIFFLRKVVKGKADKSYGIHVARIAGIPDKIIKRASYILQKLEDGTFFEEELKERYAPIQLELIHIKKTYSTSSVSQNTNAKYEKIIEEIQNINPNTLTPIEALNVINKLKQLLDN